jgi:hypothetical protein
MQALSVNDAQDLNFLEHEWVRTASLEDVRAQAAHYHAALQGELAHQPPLCLMVGSNPVMRADMAIWRAAINEAGRNLGWESPENLPLLIIRRGQEMGKIDPEAAREFGITVTNTPGINGPYVGRFMANKLEDANLPAGSKVAIIGAGDIGGRIAAKALELGLQPHIYSRSLASGQQTEKLEQTRQRIPGLEALDKSHCALSISDAINGASFLAVAVPWLPDYPSPASNAGLITTEHLQTLRHGSTILSCSNPRVFTEEALEWLNSPQTNHSIRTEIHTGTLYAVEHTPLYPNITFEYDHAFADRECQVALDIAVNRRLWEHLAQHHPDAFSRRIYEELAEPINQLALPASIQQWLDRDAAFRQPEPAREGLIPLAVTDWIAQNKQLMAG